ncbi:hypothetical protein BRADI_1g52381v3 [Brachypodium distachyon]|uniref:Uncharacterized protein n=1 Tax=Brachypodium distachyon TaxID=15368 RepID=I1H244_BRADI|nr:hypothetical protein BRADI_1g52381v3 [Brachypodium distachyon]
MGHIADPAGAVVVGCKVLPIFHENGIVDGAMRKIAHRIDGKKAVARVKELLKWATQARPYSTSVGGKKWKKVLSFQAGDGAVTKCDEMSSVSGNQSFKWDVGSCSSASSVPYSPLSFASALAAAAKTEHYTPSRNYASRLSSVSQKSSSSEACRMGQWITSDSDFVVLEL